MKNGNDKLSEQKLHESIELSRKDADFGVYKGGYRKDGILIGKLKRLVAFYSFDKE
jgi:hypothetical protein